jgi:hypothetical protein
MAKKSGKRAKKESAEPQDLLERVRGLRRIATELVERLHDAERRLLAHRGETSPAAATAPSPPATRSRAHTSRGATTSRTGASRAAAKPTTAGRKGSAAGARATTARSTSRRAPAKSAATKPATGTRSSRGQSKPGA